MSGKIGWRELVLDLLPPQVRHQRTMNAVDPKIDTELFLIDLLVEDNEIAIDVGAHRGLYSSAMKKARARVYAFEPNRELSVRLQQLLGPESTVISAGISNTSGEATFFLPVLNDVEFSTRGSLLRNDEPGLTSTRSVSVLTMRLDGLALEEVGLIKIDVEGHEMEAVLGMTETLKRERPNLIIESEARHDAHNPAQLFRFLETLEYSGFFRLHGELRRIEDFDVVTHQAQAAIGSPDYVMNFIFLPAETQQSVIPNLERRLASLST